MYEVILFEHEIFDFFSFHQHVRKRCGYVFEFETCPRTILILVCAISNNKITNSGAEFVLFYFSSVASMLSS